VMKRCTSLDPRRLEVLVLDEADRLLDMGFKVWAAGPWWGYGGVMGWVLVGCWWGGGRWVVGARAGG
jgi:hypothetical protein